MDKKKDKGDKGKPVKPPKPATQTGIPQAQLHELQEINRDTDGIADIIDLLENWGGTGVDLGPIEEKLDTLIEGQAALLDGQATSNRLLAEIVDALTLGMASSLGGAVDAIAKGSGFPQPGSAARKAARRQPMAQAEKLDYKSDVEDALLTLSPDGPLDGPPEWSGIDTGLQDDNDIPVGGTGVPRIEVEDTGNDGTTARRVIVRLPTDAATFDYIITATAKVDDPKTPEIESISSTFHIAGAHSKATNLGGATATVAKGAGFP